MGAALSGKVAVVAGATRGTSRAIAVELGRLGATVYVTGRTTRTQRSEVDRPESIEDTAELVEAAGGKAIAIRVDHLESTQVAELAARVDREQGKLDILVNGLWGGDGYLEWDAPIWKHNLENGLRQLQLGVHSHLITSHHLLPLMIRQPGGVVVEMTDGTQEYNANYRTGTTLPYYVAKATGHLLAIGQAAELEPYGCTAIGFTPGWLRSEAMLEAFGVTEENWRDACQEHPHFVISETPTFAGRTVAALVADPDHGRFAGKTVSSGQLAQLYSIDDVDGSRPDAWRYIVEVESVGKPADATGYR
ncbi:SDR family oxidoreductase [Amycolatopsis sp. 195334CR]|uniref:SDR family oxidoreductase n=1 Tax=Amycolatopsis sp. 195334CR TaxID=2814588 RepID=UPI001A8E031C|nr:SDR family oxidoreductase [Amycolatopsis sp. 195334CR]MBN6035192.1 SDR family oxidoreductase [Amycolatopsis sp. 195334CR]